MILKDGILEAVGNRDWGRMTMIVDKLRFEYRLNCNGIREYFEKVIGKEIGLPEWDEWMQECDAISSYMGR